METLVMNYGEQEKGDFAVSQGQQKPWYKLKGASLAKLGIAIVIMLLMFGAVFYGAPMLVKRMKIANTRDELNQLRTAVILYTATGSTGKAPTDFSFVIDGYTDQSGLTVKDTVPDRWKEHGIVDQWGQAYTIELNSDGVSGKIVSQGVPGDNTPISVTF